MPETITCASCGRTTTDPDLWDTEAGTERVLCDNCWPRRNGIPMPTTDAINRAAHTLDLIICALEDESGEDFATVDTLMDAYNILVALRSREPVEIASR